jgi:hypothetical protein
MPAVIFISIAVTKFQKAFDPMLIGFGAGGTIVFFCIAWLVSISVLSSGVVRGSIIHGAYRGNFAIIGFAVVLTCTVRAG